MTKLNLQLLAAETNMTAKADLEPVISIDCVSKITENIAELQNVLGITEMDAMNAGTTIKIYKMEQVNTPSQVGEGETIALTKVERKLARTVELALKKYRRSTSAEAIQKVGREIAINKTDEKLLSGIRKEIKQEFYDTLLDGTGTASGTNLQTALSAAWGAIKKFYEDEDATPIYFVSSDDVAEYLGTAQITLQQAFGLSYVQDFLGLGTVIVSPTLEKGKLIATAKENLHGAYIPASSGDVAGTFGLTSDTTGMVGMKHSAVDDNATVNTLAMSGVVFYPEMLDGVVVATIYGEATGSDGLDNLTVSSAAGTASGDTKITVSPALTSGNSYRYKVADNVTLPAVGQSVKGWTAWDGSGDITAASGKEIVVVECDASFRAVKGGVAVVTAKA